MNNEQIAEIIIAIFFGGIWVGVTYMAFEDGQMFLSYVFLLLTIIFFVFVSAPRVKFFVIRTKALKHASKFLKPYKYIWNLTLYNKNCEINLNFRNITVTNLKVDMSTVIAFQDIELNIDSQKSIRIFDFFCYNFTAKTNFESIYEVCKKLGVIVRKFTIPSLQNIISKIDINNASLEEINDLPFVNIIQAKRLIAEREKINGFKSVEEVCQFLKFNNEKSIKLREYIYLNPREIPLSEIKNDERSVDW